LCGLPGPPGIRRRGSPFPAILYHIRCPLIITNLPPDSLIESCAETLLQIVNNEIITPKTI
jgi:hypothetical protein